MINLKVICIGSNKIIEDSLGPRVGEILSSLYKDNSNVEVIGTMESPINFNNAHKLLEKFKENKEKVVIAIDSAYGEKLEIGTTYINMGGIEIGKALGKSLYLPADISIKTVVENNYNNLIKMYKTKNGDEDRRLVKINNLSRSTVCKTIEIILEILV